MQQATAAAPRLQEAGVARQGQAFYRRHAATRCGMPYHQHQVGHLIARTLQDLVEEGHRAGRVGQCRQPGPVQRGDQQATGDAGGLMRIVTLVFFTIGADSRALVEDSDQPRRSLQEWFVRIGSQRGQRLQPLGRRSMLVELALFGLGRLADAAFGFRVRYGDETPGLLVGPAGCAAGGAQAGFDQIF